MEFPIGLNQYKPLQFDLAQDELTLQQKEELVKNIQLVRDSIIFFTALANTKGLGGHTGGAYDIVPEVLIT
ncbi:MAG: transketolase, partial [Pseudomonadota bacterium]|nr:transketolase [Pseudomonadota bacterium]